MHRQIEVFLKQNSFDIETRNNGIVNDGENLRRVLAAHNGDESCLLRDIDEYSFYASNGKVSFQFKDRRTFVNVGEFSAFFSHGSYEHYLEGGGTIILTDRTLEDHVAGIWFITSPPSASGEFYLFSDTLDEIKQRIIENAKQDILSQCREHFGIWFEPKERDEQEAYSRNSGGRSGR
ncbi:MAG: hypothetical protein LIP10_13175 [Clostridiales bacterium]|nr:hypothetical protein [Clostridiales bacterium]